MAKSNTPPKFRTFIPELWSAEIIKRYKEAHDLFGRKRRDPATQLLRDAALGYPEYPDIKGDTTNDPCQTHAADAAAYLANAIDRSILDQLRDKKR
jgi:hypothetical protein